MKQYVLFFGLLTMLSFSEAQWSTNPNINNPISIAPYIQQSAHSVSDGAGGAIITWTDLRSGTNYDIYAQRISAIGVVQWAANGVAICVAAGDQGSPIITSDNAGGAIITWADSRSGTGLTNLDIYAQRISAIGVVQWAANGVAICSAANEQTFPTSSSDNAGGAIITWQDLRGGAGYDIYAQRINATGVVQWTANGVAICTAANYQQYPTITSDNAGGVIITWQDSRSGTNTHIYAQRINASGLIQWSANGAPICVAANSQTYPAITSDNAGGAIITWNDYRSGTNLDIYAQHVNATGVVQWTADGAPICVATNSQTYPAITSDNAGGAIITWNDYRSGTNDDIYAQRISAIGVVQWAANGVAICVAAGEQSSPTITSDPGSGWTGGAIITWVDLRSSTDYHIYAQYINVGGAVQWTPNGRAICTASGVIYNMTIAGTGTGGAIIAWDETRSGSITAIDIYAQNVDYYGYLGNAAPQIAGVRDIINDQGGRVNVFWKRSYLDQRPTNEIANYQVWRGASGPGATMNALVLSREGFMKKLGNGESVRNLRWTANPSIMSPSTIYWEFYANATPYQLANYYITMNTLADSAIQGVYRTFAMVTSVSALGYYWDSAPDSGYSVDNLPPSAPLNVVGSLVSNIGVLHWNPNTESDLAQYEIYRSSIPGFDPDTMLAYVITSDTLFTDANMPQNGNSYYALRAIDIHYNRSPKSDEVPIVLVGVNDVPGIPTVFSLSQNYPNPFNPTTNIRYGLPQASFVTLTVYNTLGQIVDQLLSEQQQAGYHDVVFNGDGLASGVYFYRLQAGDYVATKKLVLLR